MAIIFLRKELDILYRKSYLLFIERSNVPSISSFYGVIIYMYVGDTDRHHRPHIHAQYSGHEAQIDLDTHEILSGDLPKNIYKKVKKWMALHKSELWEDWSAASARNRDGIKRIEGLK